MCAHVCLFFLWIARKSLSPVLDSSDSVVMKRNPEEMDKELSGAESSTELSHHSKEVGGAEGQ